MSLNKQTTKQGLLLLNVGTPDEPTPQAVGRYLKEFLMDPEVIDTSYLTRWFLVNVFVVPRRSKSSATAYKKIWTQHGSPLMVHLLELVARVQSTLGASWVVKPAMRYQNPSLAAAFKDFKEKGVKKIHVFPLYPQYSTAATRSAIDACQKAATQAFPSAVLSFEAPFYQHDGFLNAFSQITGEALKTFAYDHVLFSFHGLPERQIKKLKMPGEACSFTEACCSRLTSENRDCYRAQCYETARMMASRLELRPDHYTVCFQSRLGRTSWIQPFTDHFYRTLPLQGVKRLAVICPSFVADCLETLEEVAIRGKEEFLQNGGEDLRLVPSLNSSDLWVRTVCSLVDRC